MPNCMQQVSKSLLCSEQTIRNLTLLQDQQKNVCSLALTSVNDRKLLMAGTILFAVKRTCLCCTECVLNIKEQDCIL